MLDFKCIHLENWWPFLLLFYCKSSVKATHMLRTSNSKSYYLDYRKKRF